MLQVQNVTVEVGGKNVVQGATFTVMARDKVGIVGRNGAGKTSMFRVLGGENDPAAGKVMRSGAFGYLSQDPRTSPEQEARSAIGHVLSGRNIDSDLARLEKLRVVMEKDPSDKNVAKFSKAEEEFTVKGGYSAESEARSISAGLGLKEDRLDLALGVLSGGERRRVELARILFAGSDMLLLDEPTNHLDIDAKTWLLNFLRNYKGALLVISHDLELLDEAITRVIHLDRQTKMTMAWCTNIAAPIRSTSAHALKMSLVQRRKLRCKQKKLLACKKLLTGSVQRHQRPPWRTALKSVLLALKANQLECERKIAHSQ